MCLAVLALEERYRDLRPRRPQGGPDGGRDIEALFDGEVVWGAVGFLNNVSDSDQDRRQCMKKFKDDLMSARRENQGLRRFAFLTNVDLTPTQLADLDAYARDQQFSTVDIFTRERLRIHLDSPRGLAARFQYLGIQLSDAEQRAFFAEWGDTLEEVLHQRLGAIEKQAERLEFMIASTWPMKSVKLELELDRVYSIEEMGKFRALAVVFDSHDPPNRALNMYIGMCEGQGGLADGKPCFGLKTLLWFNDPALLLQEHTYSSGFEAARLTAKAYMYKRSPFTRLRDLDQRSATIYVSKNLAPKVTSISLIANDYLLLRVEKPLYFHPVLTEIPAELRQFLMKEMDNIPPHMYRQYAPVPWPADPKLQSDEEWSVLVALPPIPTLSDATYGFPGPIPEQPIFCIQDIDFRSRTPKKFQGGPGVARS